MASLVAKAPLLQCTSLTLLRGVPPTHKHLRVVEFPSHALGRYDEEEFDDMLNSLVQIKSLRVLRDESPAGGALATLRLNQIQNVLPRTTITGFASSQIASFDDDGINTLSHFFRIQLAPLRLTLTTTE